MVHNIWGSEHIVVTLENGKVRTIGTQRPDELLGAIIEVCGLPEPGAAGDRAG